MTGALATLEDIAINSQNDTKAKETGQAVDGENQSRSIAKC